MKFPKNICFSLRILQSRCSLDKKATSFLFSFSNFYFLRSFFCLLNMPNKFNDFGWWRPVRVSAVLVPLVRPLLKLTSSFTSSIYWHSSL